MKEARAAAISAHFGRGGALSLRVCARSSLCEGSWRRSQHSNLTEASERPRCRPRPGPSCTATPPETGASNPRTQKRPSPKSGPADGASEEAMHLDIQQLQEKRDMLDKELSQLMSEGYSVDELEDHISQLHEYNDIKDVGQMLLGRLAVIRGVTTKELYPEFGLDMND